MNRNFSFEKFTPSFGSEILDALYKETPIIENTFVDFLRLPTKDNYKPSNITNFEKCKTETEPIKIDLGIIESG